MKKILAPHKEQDGYIYIRVQRDRLRHPRRFDASFSMYGMPGLIAYSEGNGHDRYDDSAIDARTISSRRVERAVETDDFLRLCAEEGLTAQRGDGVWLVGVWCDVMPTYAEGFFHHASNGGGDIGYGPTLREAYYRYHAQADV